MRSIYNLASLAATYGENFEQVARILSGDMKDFEFRPTKITPLLVKLARDYQPLAWQQNKGIEVAVKDEPGSLDNLPDVLVDKNSLIHAFSCVFDNAIKYATPNSTIRISGEKLIDKVQIHVDNVSLFHLPDNWTSRIFEAGVRHPEAIDIDPAGTGIGLWLAQRILHLHGGEIIALPSVLSKEIKGGWNTRFTFFLKTNLSYWSSLLSDLSKEIMRVE